jgi:hypothetical protein
MPELEDFLHNFQSQVTQQFDINARVFGNARNLMIAVPNNDADLQESIEMSIQEALFPLLTDGRASLIPKKTVIAFSGTLVEARRLRGGWGICDGTYQNGILKPDLRSKFIRGAADGSDAGGEGGADCSNVSVDSHSPHTGNLSAAECDSKCTVLECSGGVDVSLATHTHELAGSMDDHDDHVVTQSDNKPPYYEVIFLCKV